MWTGAVDLEAAAMHGMPGIFGLEKASAAATVDAGTGGVGEDELDKPVGENGTGELEPVGDKCL